MIVRKFKINWVQWNSHYLLPDLSIWGGYCFGGCGKRCLFHKHPYRRPYQQHVLAYHSENKEQRCDCAILYLPTRLEATAGKLHPEKLRKMSPRGQRSALWLQQWHLLPVGKSWYCICGDYTGVPNNTITYCMGIFWILWINGCIGWSRVFLNSSWVQGQCPWWGLGHRPRGG